MAKKPREEEQVRRWEFEVWWDVNAQQGWCDDRPGAEYRRVKSEWIAAGKPANVTAFIRLRANFAPLPSAAH
jgi:hypothetical protein